MEDHGRKQETANALDELDAALAKFSSEAAADEIGAKLAAMVHRLRAAALEKRSEWNDLPDVSKKVSLDDARKLEERADELEKEHSAAAAAAIERRFPASSMDGEQSDGGDDDEAEEISLEHLQASLQALAQTVEKFAHTQRKQNENVSAELHILADRIEVLEQIK